MYKNVMYVVGGFDGSRLNDMHQIALPLFSEEDYINLRKLSRPVSSASSGVMQTVPSDLVTISFFKFLAHL